ncbi:MAG: histidine phosphatase family protein [Candidatus Dormibacteraceae bacterium]
MTDSGIRPLPPDAPAPAAQPSTRVFLVRHAQSTWNEERRIQGQRDPPLSRLGQSQAGALGERLAKGRWAAFYSSDLERALETAAPLASRIDIPLQRDPDLREIGLGEWEGLTREQLVACYPERWASWRSEPDWDLVPGGEGADAFERRVRVAIAGLFDRHPEGDVLAVTHGGVIQVALAAVVGRTSRGPFTFVVGNASLTVIQRRDGRHLIGRVNDACHLEALRAPAAAETTLPR